MRTVELTSRGTAVHLEGGLLRIERPDQPPRRLPVDDFDLLVVEAAQVLLSGAALAALAAAGVPVLLCDARHLPAGWLTPAGGRAPVNPDRARAQAGMIQRTADRLWKDIVEAKILQQADLLRDLGMVHAPVRRFAEEVAGGDPDNREAAAAGAYWRTLLDGVGTRRDGGAVSVALDWGYAVLRAILARAIIAAGLHPGIGLKHRGESDPFPLAADLMEPFRPAVDRIVRGLAPVLPDMKPPDWKARLAALGDTPVQTHGQDWTLRSAVGETVRSYARIVDAGKGSLILPERLGTIGERRRSHAGCVSEDVAPRLL